MGIFSFHFYCVQMVDLIENVYVFVVDEEKVILNLISSSLKKKIENGIEEYCKD